MNMHVRRNPRLLAVITLFALSTGAAAGSNLPESYPGPACGERPAVPERPEKFETGEAIAEYNAKVESYNASIERLVACVREYATNAAADIEDIRKRSREAIDRLNQ